MRMFPSLFSAGLIGLTLWTLVCVRTYAADTSGPPTKSDEGAARDMIEDACKRRPELHGAWVILKEIASEPQQFEATILVDRDRAAAQLPELERLIDKLPLEPKPRRGAVRELPVSQLIAKFRAGVEADPRFGKGTFVQGAYFKPSPNQAPEFVLFGRCIKKEQPDAIIGICELLMEKDPVWKNLEISLHGLGLKVRDRTAKAAQDAVDLQRELAADRHLHGTWIELEECFDHDDQFLDYDVYVRFDAARSTDQLATLRKLLANQIDRPYKIVEELALPFSELLSTVNFHLEASSKFSASIVQDAYFALQSEQGKGVLLKLVGRVEHKQQADDIERLCAELIKLDRRWPARIADSISSNKDAPLTDYIPNVQELVVESPSETQAGILFNEGLTHFWQARFSQAERAFHHASVNAPNMIEYRYWRVLSLVKMERNDEAYDRVVALTLRGVSPVTYRRVLQSLERVQGPIRMEVMELEDRARKEYYLYRRNNAPPRAANRVTSTTTRSLVAPTAYHVSLAH